MPDLSSASGKFYACCILNFKMRKGSTGAGNGIVTTNYLKYHQLTVGNTA